MHHVLRETILEWHRQFPEDQLSLVVRRKHYKGGIRDVPAGVQLHPSRLWPQALLATLAVPRYGRRIRADAVYTQNFAARYASVSAVFIHDVLFETNPEWFTLKERLYFRWMPRLAPLASVVFTSSSTEADRISAHSRAEMVVPVGIAMSSELLESGVSNPRWAPKPGRFLLTVGRLNVRKNVATTIRACIASGVLGADRPLVVVGGLGGKPEDLPDDLRCAINDGRVVMAGHVPDPELVWLYKNTELFLFLTKGEGFGMPAIEALHFGAPMIVSDIPVFREILPSTVRRVDPHNDAAIESAIRTSLTCPRLDRAAPGDNNTWPEVVRKTRTAMLKRLESSDPTNSRRAPFTA